MKTFGMSLLATFAAAPALVAGASLHSRFATPAPSTFSSLAACGAQPAVYSCENTTIIENTCCSPTPGGLVLATQYWNTYTGLESSGQFLPAESWTIHGFAQSAAIAIDRKAWNTSLFALYDLSGLRRASGTLNATPASNCAATGIHYYERTPSSEVSKYLS
ncbi:hypothetical protein P7C70_g556, partial [Phenoliferia sp. Uapishka_3]